MNIPKEVKVERWVKALSQEGFTDLWLSDCKLRGYVRDYYEQEDSYTWTIMEDQYEYYKEFRTVFKGTKREEVREEIKKHKIFARVEYTPDRTITWEDKAHGVFFKTLEDISNGKYLDCYFIAHKTSNVHVSYIDTKAPPTARAMNCSDASFRIKSKWLWEKYKIVINKVYNYPTGKKFSPGKYLYIKTFTPFRFLLTDTGQSMRGINKWNAITIDDYVQRTD